MEGQKEIPAETRFDDMTGAASINFREGESLQSFAAKIAHVDLDRYQPIFMRLYVEHYPIITIYALDKANYQAHHQQTGKLLVRKYKVDVKLEEVLGYFKQLDFFAAGRRLPGRGIRRNYVSSVGREKPEA